MNSSRVVPVLAALLGLLLSSASGSAAQSAKPMPNSCVAPEAEKAVNACPGGPKTFEIKQKRGTAFKSAPPPREVNAQKDAKPKNPDTEMAAGQRDARKTRLQARGRALLITEIQGLERLFKRTGKRSPDRPQLIRRLAEAYVELESAANRDKIEAEVKAQDLKSSRSKGKVAAINKARKEAGQARKIVDAARKKAIAYYKLMKTAYPSYSKIDEVLYYLAYEYEQAKDLKNARAVYYELIQKAPKSPYIPNAYLAFGELFFLEAQADPSAWELAEQSYRKVTEYPPPTNKVFGYAHYKLGYVYWNQGEYAKALQEFKEVIQYGDKYASLPNAKQLAKSARRDMIPVYAASGRPETAYNFFKGLSGDGAGESTKTIDMLNELGLAYLDTGHYREAITLYKDLMSRDKGDKLCFYQGQITGAVMALSGKDKDSVKKELERQLSVRNGYVKESHADKSKLECSNVTAGLLAETAMSWHLEAVGSGGVRGTGDKKTMDLAAYLYQKIADNFTSQEFAKFEFPRIVKEDWPNLYKIKYAMADLLYFQERWDKCGPAFDAVVAENPTGPDAAEAAFASVLCYQKMYDQIYKGDADRKGKGLGPKGGSADKDKDKSEWEKLKPKDFTDTQKGMVTAFNRYVCYVKPPKGDAKAYDNYVDVKFARARTYFESQHWEEAALAFRDIAINHADHESAVFAAQLYLESVNVLGAKADPPRPSCFDAMGSDVPLFIESFCSGKKAEDNAEQCETLNRIQCDIQRLKAQKTVELADSTQTKGEVGKALELYKEGGDAYLELWRTYGEKQLEDGQKSQCGAMDEIVYNMAKAYQAGRLLAKSVQARLILLNPRYGMNKTDLALKATYEIGGNYQAIAVYDKAADFYEKYAADTKYKGEFADQALSDAVVLRLGLGQEDQAIDDANKFNRYYGARKAEQAAQVAFAVAAYYAEKKDWGQVAKRLQGAMRLIDSKASLDVKVQAHALAGHAYMELNRGRNADSEYGTVVATWKDPKKAADAITASGGDARKLGRALEAVGEAMFYFAEKKRAKVEAVKFPEYKGAGTTQAVKDHINTKVKAWITKKRPLIEDATAEYKKIVDLVPAPPPKWVIAAGSRVGDMWGTFVKEFRAAPIPSWMKQDYELRTAYYGALDDASEPQKQMAKGAYRTCLDYSVKYQYFDEFSRTCEEWLADNYKNEYHLIDEFRGSPNLVNSTLKERPYPISIGGEPFVTAPPEAEEADKPGASKE
ncbi:MAG: tetratricopeptide repeat protein [Polyangiaceae bacterium]